MTLTQVLTLYRSPNGDVWTAAMNDAGRLLVVHQPNPASRGQRTEMTERGPLRP
jgi:hypothetical protein